jgi:hypothetical protein
VERAADTRQALWGLWWPVALVVLVAGCNSHRSSVRMGRELPSISAIPASVARLKAPPLPDVPNIAWIDDCGKRCDYLALHWPGYGATCPELQGAYPMQDANRTTNITCAQIQRVLGAAVAERNDDVRLQWGAAMARLGYHSYPPRGEEWPVVATNASGQSFGFVAASPCLEFCFTPTWKGYARSSRRCDSRR